MLDIMLRNVSAGVVETDGGKQIVFVDEQAGIAVRAELEQEGADTIADALSSRKGIQVAGADALRDLDDPPKA